MERYEKKFKEAVSGMSPKEEKIVVKDIIKDKEVIAQIMDIIYEKVYNHKLVIKFLSDKEEKLGYEDEEAYEDLGDYISELVLKEIGKK